MKKNLIQIYFGLIALLSVLPASQVGANQIHGKGRGLMDIYYPGFTLFRMQTGADHIFSVGGTRRDAIFVFAEHGKKRLRSPDIEVFIEDKEDGSIGFRVSSPGIEKCMKLSSQMDIIVVHKKRPKPGFSDTYLPEIENASYFELYAKSDPKREIGWLEIGRSQIRISDIFIPMYGVDKKNRACEARLYRTSDINREQ